MERTLEDIYMLKILKNVSKTRKLLKEEKGGYPTFLLYECTRNCNARCVMCNIWKEKVDRNKELSYKEIPIVFSQDFFKDLKYINLTGGETFLKSDINEIIKELINTVSSLELIAISTNGFLTKKIKKSIIEILDFIEENNKSVKISVTISIDGLKEIHNKMRGVNSAYDSAMSTFYELKDLEDNYNSFTVGIETVITRYNAEKIDEIYEAHKKLTRHLNFTMAICTDYYSNQDLDFSIKEKDKQNIISFFKKLIRETPHLAYYYDKVIYYLKYDKRKFPCLGGTLTAKMNPYGDLYPCHMLHRKLAGRTDNYSKAWFGEKMNKYRKEYLHRSKVCQACLNNCDIINNYKYEFIDVVRYYITHPYVSLRFITMIVRDFCKGGYYARVLRGK